MERNEFLSALGIGALGVCMGSCLSACSKSDSGAPSSGNNTNNPPPPAGTTFTADLGSSLTNIGDTKVSNGIILARVAAGNTASSFTAVQVACTHEGTSINYNNGQGVFICPLHGSIFSKTGAVVQGPASTALKQYAISITGSTLTVTV
ncbi:QcrA and Rieske domain-containing protein [Mucilaginibacter antarcticus]|uniref:Ubiquinol-cytochrome c reductase iron-sulfur subunit n=1 Tax=Mucilaginibacter antarcticus TaxID=1855725 RepID=A0ABW5XTM0_9SPHI